MVTPSTEGLHKRRKPNDDKKQDKTINELPEQLISELYHKSHPEEAPSLFHKRSLFFIFGIVFGVLGGFIFSQDLDPLAALNNLDLDGFSSSLDLAGLLSSMPDLSMNVSEILAPGREFMKNRQSVNFEIGREAVKNGDKKAFAVVIIPGIISSGLESFSTTPQTSSFFREKIWSGMTMFKAIITRKEEWIAAMALDAETGLDNLHYKVRAVQGLEGASSFITGFWLWSKVIENLAVLGYDPSDLDLATYDWRLTNYNLEVRDQYFSRLRSTIEFNLEVNGKKTVLVSHSMGSQVALYFFKWVESDLQRKGGGKGWVERHIASLFSIAGTFLGVPKAQAALLSGEMRDTVEINPAGAKLLERFFSKSERVKLFRSWGGSSAMILKGGNAVWGNNESAPDDKENATLSGGNIFYFKSEEATDSSQISSETTSNLTLNEAHDYILQHAPSSFQRMLDSNYSFGFERDSDKIQDNDKDHRKWTNPLEFQLPNAPSMSIYCVYGVGKETERSYWYQNGGYTKDEAEPTTCTAKDCSDSTSRAPLDLPLARKSWIDSSITLENENPKVRSGVIFGEGDGTVSLLSLGAMSVNGWKRKLYNPANISVTTVELLHNPMILDIRGGPTTADHVDILGSTEMQQLLMDVVSGNGHRIKERIISDIVDYSHKIDWEGLKEK